MRPYENIGPHVWGFHLDILQELRNSGRIVMSVVVIWGISKHILEQYKQRRVPYRRHRHCLVEILGPHHASCH